MRYLEADYQGNEILTAKKGAIGLVALNRPRVLNSLSHDMILDFGKALDAFEADPDVAAVLVTGEGERGLCAGGDIRMFYESGKAGDGKASHFLKAEYRLNARIAGFKKPYVVVMDGITMGGGVGVSSHGSHRIVTESTKLAMPETGIGFFPDIGATWLLSRASGELGTWMGLTGEAINGADAITAGFADWYVPQDRIAELLERVAALPAPALGQSIASTISEARAWASARVSPRAVTFSTRPPMAVIAPSFLAVPAWNTMLRLSSGRASNPLITLPLS